MAKYKSRNRYAERRRRAEDDYLQEEEDDQDDDIIEPRSNIGWIVVVGLIGAGIFWLAKTSSTKGLPDSVRAAAQIDTAHPESQSQTNSVAIDPTHALAKPTPSGRKEALAVERLKAVAVAYRQLDAYEDVTRMQLRYPVGNQIQEENAELSFKFQRPNRLRLEVVKEGHRVVVTCDGEKWNSRIIDPTTDNFDNQFVVADAEEEQNVNSIYAATEYINRERPSELLNALMSLPAPLLVSQVAFLLEPESLDRMIKSSHDIRMLSPQSMQGRDCERIRVSTGGGSFVFWIDRRQDLVRRIQFPTADLQPGQSTTHLGKSMLQCDYGRLRTPLNFPADTFQLAQPENVKLVRNFILPPQRDPNSPLNQRVGNFWFTDLRNERTPANYWQDKVSLLVWWNNHPTSQAALESLASTYEAFKDDSRVSMLAVSSIPSTLMSHDDVQRIADRWDIALPVVRDGEAFGRDKFKVSQAPTIVVLDRDGRVQLHETAASPELGAQIQSVLERILNGDNLAAEYLKFLESGDAEYSRMLAAASLHPPPIDLTPKVPELHQPTMPSQLQIRELWTNDHVIDPGNVVVSKRGLRHQLLVHSRTDSLVQLSAYGSVQEQFKLQTPAGRALMTNLRTAADRTGRVFHLALAAMGKQIHLFDDRWQHLMSYPDENISTAAKDNGIQDARIADLDDDGELEVYVAFNDAGGVHRVNLHGRREWTNESVAPVYSLTVSPDETGRRFLLITNDKGGITPLDHEGAPQKPIEIPSWSIHHLTAAPVKAGVPSGYCGVSQMPDGSLVAVGFSPGMSELWSEPLSSGTFRTAIDFVQTATWNGGEPFWLIATPEGAIHVVSQDGELHDRFQTGKTIHGLAGFEMNDRNVLVVSWSDGVTAWEVSLPE